MSLVQFSIILAIIFVDTIAEVCNPKFLLQNLIHQSVSIYTFTSTNSITTATMPFNFEQSFFNTKPKIITSISQLSCNQYKEINYLLSTEIQGSSVVFKFSSANMKWTSLEINFLLHSRADLFSITRTLTTLQIEKQTSVSYRLEGADQFKEYVVINFIVGVLISSSKAYSISITPFSISTGQYQITAISTSKATITIQSLYFLATQDKFVYSFNSYQFSQNNNQKSITLWDDFSPNVYTIYGFTSWTLTGGSFSLSSHFNIIKNSIAIDNLSGSSSLNMSYFALGQLPSKICSPCDNFITITGCIDKCPSGSYGEDIVGGGKICRLCDQTLGQYVNNEGNACACQNGLTFHEGRCLNGKIKSQWCRPYQIIINGQCTSRLVGLTSQCPAKSILNSGICVCQSGYLMSASKQCISVCPSNSFYNQIESTCICYDNFQMIKGVCVPCTVNQSFNSQLKLCVAKITDPSGKVVICDANEVIIDNSCKCIQNSYIVHKRCVPCPAETYKIANLNKCGQCPTYCSQCLNSFQCSKCNKGFKINSQGCDEICGDGIKFILPCDDGNTVSGDGCSSDCQIESNYVCNGGNSKRPDICSLITFNDVLEIKRPKISFLSSGIVTELIVTPPIKRTNQELSSLFSVSFTKKEVTPKNIFFSQSNNDYRSIRCYFAYHNNVPNDIFSATFEMTDKTFGSSKIILLYNPFRGGITSAIRIGSGDYNEDILNR